MGGQIHLGRDFVHPGRVIELYPFHRMDFLDSHLFGTIRICLRGFWGPAFRQGCISADLDRLVAFNNGIATILD